MSLTKDLDEDSRKTRLEELQGIFSSSLDKHDKGLMLLTEEYNQYKRNYVEHIQFDPADKNLSEPFLQNSNYSQLSSTNMLHLRLSTSTLTRQRLMKLNGM